MNNKDSVYKFIIDNINSVVDDGIYYYDSINTEYKNKLLAIKEFVNSFDKVEEEPVMEEPEIVIEEVIEKPKIELDYTKINALTADYIDKITNIKVDILNLETKLPLYHVEDQVSYTTIPFENIEIKPKEEAKKVEIKEIVPIDMSSVFDDFMDDEQLVKNLDEIDLDNDKIDGIEVKSSIRDIFSK